MVLNVLSTQDNEILRAYAFVVCFFHYNLIHTHTHNLQTFEILKKSLLNAGEPSIFKSFKKESFCTKWSCATFKRMQKTWADIPSLINTCIHYLVLHQKNENKSIPYWHSYFKQTHYVGFFYASSIAVTIWSKITLQAVSHVNIRNQNGNS